MERYKGLFFFIKYLFLHYISLSGPIVLVSISIGLAATIAGLVLLFNPSNKKYIAILAIVAVVPIIIGIEGALLNINSAKEALSIEQKYKIEPTARRYDDIQYLYRRELFYAFPAVVGTLSTLAPLIVVYLLKRKASIASHKK